MNLRNQQRGVVASRCVMTVSIRLPEGMTEEQARESIGLVLGTGPEEVLKEVLEDSVRELR